MSVENIRHLQAAEFAGSYSSDLDKRLLYLNPRRKHIEISEAKRIENSICELVENIKVGLLVANSCKYKKLVHESKQLQAALRHHQEVTNKMIQRRHKGNVQTIIEDHKSFKTSLKKLIQIYKKDNINKEQERKLLSPSSEMLIQFVEDLWGIVENKLLTTPEEKQQKYIYVSEVLVRSRKSHDRIVSMEKQLQEMLDEKNKEIAQQNLQINLQRDDLENKLKEAEKDHGNIILGTQLRMQADNKKLNKFTNEKMQEIVPLRQQLDMDRKKHYSDERALRKKRYKLVTELHNWITKYDEELERKQEEIDDLKEEAVVNEAHLKELEPRMAQLKIKYDEVVKERETKEEQKRIKLLEIAKKIQASVVIQRAWKRYVFNQMLAGKTVGKKKKEKAKGKQSKGKK
eukprot:gene7306-8122_t